MPEPVAISAEEAVDMFSALADSTRLRLLSLLAKNGETCVCDLVEATTLNQTTVSRHLSTLRHAGLVTGRKQGLWVYYSLVKAQNEVHRQILSMVRKASDTIPELEKDAVRLKSSCCAEESKPVTVRLPAKAA